MAAIDILIADDQTSVAQELKARVEGLGYRVVDLAHSSDEALSKIEVLHPHLILMNIRLKGKTDGILTGNLIRANHQIPLIYIIDSSSQAAIQRASSTAPYGYIFRPFDDNQIYATIETALQRHILENQFQQSRQWLNTTLTSIADGVIATDEHGLVRFINPIAMEQTGWHQSEALGKSIADIFSLRSEDTHEPIDILGIHPLSVSLTHKKAFSGQLLSRDGKSLQVDATITSIQDGKGTAFGMVLISRDLTRQRQNLEEIRRQASRAEALSQVAARMNSHLELEVVLSTICEITNRTLQASGTVVLLPGPQMDSFQNRAAISQDPALKAYHGVRFSVAAGIFESLLSRERPVLVIDNLQDHSDLPYFDMYHKADIRTLAIAGLFRGSRLAGALVSAFVQQPKNLLEDDMALLRGLADQASSAIENAELFEQIKSGRERQRKLAKNMVEVQETERRRLARELHDHLGQILTGLQFMLETAKNQAVDVQKSNLEEIQGAVRDIIREVREMSLDLRPSMLDDMGLVPTLLWHINRYTSQTGIHVNFQYEEYSQRIPLEIETAAYRIVQEALTNAARHAQVKEVFIGLVLQGDTLWVEVLDNGRGFDVNAEQEKPSTGLSGMRERAFLLGGYLLVESFLNQGTQIVAALPLTDHPLERRRHDRHPSAG
ncbi:MAG TPA: histidine kinase [Anaerolineales bacterium]|nr:histidine kinase [Anaerolineales bacterium]